jgi:hypothetical protein
MRVLGDKGDKSADYILGLSQFTALQNEEKDAAFKQEISDFELIDDELDTIIQPKEVYT